MSKICTGIQFLVVRGKAGLCCIGILSNGAWLYFSCAGFTTNLALNPIFCSIGVLTPFTNSIVVLPLIGSIFWFQL